MTAAIPIIALTAHAMQEDLERGGGRVRGLPLQARGAPARGGGGGARPRPGAADGGKLIAYYFTTGYIDLAIPETVQIPGSKDRITTLEAGAATMGSAPGAGRGTGVTGGRW